MQIGPKELKKIKLAIKRQNTESDELQRKSKELEKFLARTSKQAEKIIQNKAS